MPCVLRPGAVSSFLVSLFVKFKLSNLLGVTYPYSVGIVGSQGFDPIYFTDLSQDSFNISDLRSGFYSFSINDVNNYVDIFSSFVC